MIATASAPDNPKAPQSWLIFDRRSAKVFDPTQDPAAAKYNPWVDASAGLDQPTTAKYLVSPASTCKAATVRVAPTAGRALIRAFLGDVVPGDDIVAIPYNADGSPLADAWDVPMSVRDEGRYNEAGSVVLALPGVAGAPPTL